ncbi:MAG: tetratricopeptide repeat protein [Candidatus Spyradocola sp.]
MDFSKIDLTPFARVGFESKTDTELAEIANKGNGLAAFEMGKRCEAKGVMDTAAKWYMKAAELGDNGGLFKIGLYYDGEGEYKKAAEYFEKVISLGQIDKTKAKYILGNYYMQGKIGFILTRKKKGFDLVQSAAEEGYPSAQFLAGLATLNGYGPKVQIEESIAWIRCAQLNGDEEANEYIHKFINDARYTEQFRRTVLNRANQMIDKSNGVYYTLK